MRPSIKPLRALGLAAAVAAISFGTAACNPKKTEGAAPAADKAAAAQKPEAAAAPAGLATEKDKASYLIGRDIGRTLTPLKDEIDLSVVMKAAEGAIKGEASKLTDEEGRAVMQSFSQRIQAKQQAEAKAKAETNLAEGARFLEANAKKEGVKTTASGLQYTVVTEGKGPKPRPSDTVVVHYTGTLLNGEKFDSSRDRGEPARFRLDQVVPGWKEGLQLMSAGGKTKFWIPAALGYGEQGTPGGPIPPNATLVFDVELIEIAKK